MFEANLASYVFLAMVVGVYWLEGTFNRYGGAYQASAVGSLRTLNTAEITYSSTYNQGFSASLADLAPGTAATPTAEAAGLIDSVLASGEKSGYRFVYSAGPRDANGRIDTYTITASPIKPGATETNYYYTDQTGVIRQNSTGPASATDSPLAG
jgi:hypothetical protein